MIDRSTETQHDGKPLLAAVSPIYKVLDLFGNEQTVIINTKKKEKPNLFTDYDAFLDKFEVKKTTDDCYTPKEVMDIVINYVNEKYPQNYCNHIGKKHTFATNNRRKCERKPDYR